MGTHTVAVRPHYIGGQLAVYSCCHYLEETPLVAQRSQGGRENCRGKVKRERERCNELTGESGVRKNRAIRERSLPGSRSIVTE